MQQLEADVRPDMEPHTGAGSRQIPIPVQQIPPQIQLPLIADQTLANHRFRPIADETFARPPTHRFSGGMAGLPPITDQAFANQAFANQTFAHH